MKPLRRAYGTRRVSRKSWRVEFEKWLVSAADLSRVSADEWARRTGYAPAKCAEMLAAARRRRVG